MKATKNMKPLARAGAVLALVIIAVSGVTFAALQSQQVKFQGNTIETATANLQLSPDGNTYTTSQTGFDFGNIVPGGRAVPNNGYGFFLKNAGATPLVLRFSVSSTPSNPDDVDLSKVNVILTPTGAGSPQSFTLASLISANSTGGQTINTPPELLPSVAYQYSLQVSMATDAIDGPSASLGNIDFAFNGLAQSN
jgi:hypothetical protein